jgi:hypothetical protein
MKKTLLSTLAVLITCGILSVGLSGCAWSIGEGKDRTTTNQPTRGQELVDLKKALDQGAISQAEYENQKKQILTR